jgi:hypothetical protein
MPVYYVSPDGSDTADGQSESSPLKTLDHVGELAFPGCEVILLPGIYPGGKFYGSDAHVSGTHLPLVFRFRPGAMIRGGNSRAHGLTIEGWNGVEIYDCDIADLANGVNGCGIWLAGCRNVIIQRPKIDNCQKWGIHTPYCHDVLIEDGSCTRSRVEHGIYFANSCSNVTARRMKLLGNRGCGIHNNADGENPPPYASLPFLKQIKNLTVEECTFGYNGESGGADVNMDGVVGGAIRRNFHLPTRGKGNCYALFNSSANPANPFPTQDVVIEENFVFAGPSKYNLFVFGGDMPKNVAVRNNVLVHTGWPANQSAGLLELMPNDGKSHENVEFSGNRLSHHAVVTPDGIESLFDVVDGSNNTILVADEIAAILATLPVVADPGLGIAPGPSTVPGTTPVPSPNDWLGLPALPNPLPPIPATVLAPAPANSADVDENEQSKLWLREWHEFTTFGTPLHSALLSPAAWTNGYNSPIGGYARYSPGFGTRWKGFIRPDRTGVHDILARFIGYHELWIGGERISEGVSNNHESAGVNHVVHLEAGKYYAFEFALKTNEMYTAANLAYRTAEKPDVYLRFPEGWYYPPKVRPGAPAPTDPTPVVTPPVVTLPPTTTQPPVVAPADSYRLTITVDIPKALVEFWKN